MTHPLIEQLGHADPAVRRAACQAAGEDPAGVILAEALAAALGDPVKAVGRAASDALVALARRAESGAADTWEGLRGALRSALHSGERAQRWRAAFTWARLEPPSPRLLPALVEALASADGDVRWAATRVIVEMGHRHGEVLPVLIGLVRSDESPVVRRMASYALRELAPDREEAADVLLEATLDPDLQVRRAALTAMASLLGPPTRVGERLLAALREDEDGAARRLAALALGEIGARHPEALPGEAATLLERVRNEAANDHDLRRSIDRALARLAAGQPGS